MLLVGFYQILGPTFGDPHISTLDGQSYDYNGIGEYWMIKSPALYIQGRTEQAKDIYSKLVAGSVFGAYAIQIPESANKTMSDRIFLRMGSSEESENILIKSILYQLFLKLRSKIVW